MKGIEFLPATNFNAAESKTFLLTFFLFGLSLIFITAANPIGDFANYYYGSKFFFEGIDVIKFYRDIHFFNSEIRLYESGTFFENFTPVPPFSLLAYLPFLFFKCTVSKIVFNFCGLLVLLFSVSRLIKSLSFFSYWFYLLPFIFFQSLYSNFHQGQSYLLICALLIEFYLCYIKEAKLRSGLIVAILFSLKIFPVFIILLPFCKKDKKTMAFFIIFLVFVQSITYICIGGEPFWYYYLEVLPRLAINDVTEPFGYFNQSLHVFLINLFVFHPYLNPSPLLNLPMFVPAIQAIVYGFILSVFIKALSTRTVYESFAMLILALILINQYSPVYSLLLSLPAVFLLRELKGSKKVLMLLILLLAFNIPVYKLSGLSTGIQYIRLWLLLIYFVIIGYQYKLKPSLLSFVILVALFGIASLGFQNRSLKQGINLSGNDVVYDFKTSADHIKLFSCLGNSDTTRRLSFQINKVQLLTVSANSHRVMFGENTLYRSAATLKKSVLVNDTSLLVLSDENRGVGMYRLIHFIIK